MKNLYALFLLLGMTFSTTAYAETETATENKSSEVFVTANDINPYEKTLDFNVAEALTHAQPQADPKMDLDFFKSVRSRVFLFLFFFSLTRNIALSPLIAHPPMNIVTPTTFMSSRNL